MRWIFWILLTSSQWNQFAFFFLKNMEYHNSVKPGRYNLLFSAVEKDV